MNEFEKYELVNKAVRTEEVFDYIGAKIDADDRLRRRYCCPYHTDDLPSLNVDLQTGRFNCFACDNKGGGSYAAAKYYLEDQAGTKVSAITVINFLMEINPAIAMYKPMFVVKSHREYEYGVNKRRAFERRPGKNNSGHILRNNLASLTEKEHANYIDAVMMGLSDEFIGTNLITRFKPASRELPSELIDLLGDDD